MFADKIISWYAENGRRLPWRGIDNPYYIWLSEIILQQTRIEQGRSYYEHFVTQYPTVRDLAEASEEQVLKSWQGLGYYSRARNLHEAAKYVAFELDGKFPSTYEDILSLKGVGRYTAAAIASFAFGLPYPVIDGNVYRLVARLYRIATPVGTDQAYREFEKKLLYLIDKERPGVFNQAMMDFGSLYCKPVGCDCANCIFSQECMAYRDGVVAELPVRPQPVKVKERYFYYFDIRWKIPQPSIVVQRRGEGDIWQGLYELPLYETERSIGAGEMLERLQEVLQEWMGEAPQSIEAGPCLTHRLTHRTIKAQFVRVIFDCQPPRMPEKMQAVGLSEMKSLPISRLIDRYLSEL
jgi:A/G-specific adenine glycosylase